MDLSASALYVGPGETITLVLSSARSDEYEAYLQQLRPDLGELELDEVLPGAGADAIARDLANEGQPGWWYFTATSNDPTMPVVPGDHFWMDYRASEKPGVALFVLYDVDGHPLSELQIHQIPEPTSIIGFGLAGICLAWRRRRQSAPGVSV